MKSALRFAFRGAEEGFHLPAVHQGACRVREKSLNMLLRFLSLFKDQTSRTVNFLKLIEEITDTVPWSNPEADDLKKNMTFLKDQTGEKKALKIPTKAIQGRLSNRTEK